jgi:hypothetical protein
MQKADSRQEVTPQCPAGQHAQRDTVSRLSENQVAESLFIAIPEERAAFLAPDLAAIGEAELTSMLKPR